MKSVCISYNFSARSIFDAYEPRTDSDVTRFRDRLAQDRTASPTSEIRAIRLYENGTSEALE
jgi:hypothetical protein